GDELTHPETQNRKHLQRQRLARSLLGPVSFPSRSRQTKDIVYKFNVQAALIMEKTATVQTDSDMVCSICI
ncbi:hypothetical protein, partial [Neglectibacter timonensis]|uniref:hypothetical protein n=1 Tax=Neglectibacter timonensis TaxID=1776382 RepID=UPI0039A219DD